MVRVEKLDFELLHMSGIIMSRGAVKEMIARRFEQIGARWVVEHDSIAWTHTRHFEGIDLLGEPGLVEEAMTRIAAAFSLIRTTCEGEDR